MTIPDYESLMRPLLETIRDGQEHTLRQTTEELAARYQLSEAERNDVLPSGQARFDNRVGWAKMYLKQGRLIESTGRGRFRITAGGLNALRETTQKIDSEYLKRFPEPTSPDDPATTPDAGVSASAEGVLQTPEEVIESGYQKLRQELARELLQQARGCSPRFFEKLVLDLIKAMGYGGSVKNAGEVVGRSGDGGVDGMIKGDKLGLDVLYLQAKRWEAKVGRPILQGFAGSLEGFKARKGVLLTTSKFSEEAKEYSRHIGKRIVLIDGEHLAELMIDHGIGVTEVTSYAVKRVNQDYFGED
ncbi:MAG: restriction endonuclease [Acidobacteriales bacterium]|nr:restriction endonuclease [Terriglobales bacterium]